MTIRELREIIVHFQDREYDDYDVTLFDYNGQQDLKWGGSYAFSKTDKRLVFPVSVPPVDGITIEERLKKIINGKDI